MKRKPNPATQAEDHLFKNAKPSVKLLLQASRKLKRDAARAAWWKDKDK